MPTNLNAKECPGCSACTGPFAHTTPDTYISNPTIRPGDIVTFGLDGIKHGRPSDYGHVEVVGSRPLRQIVRSFLARLAGSVRGRK